MVSPPSPPQVYHGGLDPVNTQTPCPSIKKARQGTPSYRAALLPRALCAESARRLAFPALTTPIISSHARIRQGNRCAIRFPLIGPLGMGWDGAGWDRMELTGWDRAGWDKMELTGMGQSGLGQDGAYWDGREWRKVSRALRASSAVPNEPICLYRRQTLENASNLFPRLRTPAPNRD